MNAKQLITVIGETQDSYITAALATREAAPRHLSLKRTLLIAAVIALTLTLVGCAVVYALRLQDMSIGQETYTQRFDSEGRAVEPTEKTRDIVTLYGHSGDPIQQALAEWYDFLETYDPDGKLMTNEPNLPQIEDRYEFTYDCYTPEMAAKVDEIAAKYDLKLLDTYLVFQQYQSDIFLEETGIGSLLLSNTGAEIRHMAGVLYPPYNFKMEFELVLAQGTPGTWVTLLYTQKDYFPVSFSGSRMDLNDFEQWDHTAADGTQVLIALSNKGQSYILAQLETASLILSIDGNRSGSSYPDESQIITKEELTAMADLFDYSISPREVDRTAVEEKLAEAEAAYQAEHAYVPEVYGGFSDYLKDTVSIYQEGLRYTFYDLTGDGADDLLLGRSDGSFYQWAAMVDGQVRSCHVTNLFLCEGRVLHSVDDFGAYYDQETHMYYSPVSDTALLDPDSGLGMPFLNLQRTQDRWRKGEDFVKFTTVETTEAEAHNLMAQYPHLKLDWKPLMDYPLDDKGTTLGDWLNAKDVRLSGEDLREVYADHLRGKKDLHYTHYRILDVNGDGVEDLLLSGDGEKYWTIYTYRYGIVYPVTSMDFYLCEDGILEQSYNQYISEGVEEERHHFLRLNVFREEELDLVVYNKATASYQSDIHGTPVPREEAEATLAKYMRIDQGMQPISDLLN